MAPNCIARERTRNRRGRSEARRRKMDIRGELAALRAQTSAENKEVWDY